MRAEPEKGNDGSGIDVNFARIASYLCSNDDDDEEEAAPAPPSDDDEGINEGGDDDEADGVGVDGVVDDNDDDDDAVTPFLWLWLECCAPPVLGRLLPTGDLIFFLATATREGQLSVGQDNTEEAKVTSLLLVVFRLLLMVLDDSSGGGGRPCPCPCPWLWLCRIDEVKGSTHTRGSWEGEETTNSTLPLPLPLPLPSLPPPLPALPLLPTLPTVPVPVPVPALPPATVATPARAASVDTSKIAQDMSSVNARSSSSPPPVDITRTLCTTPESVSTVYKASTLPQADAKMTGV